VNDYDDDDDEDNGSTRTNIHDLCGIRTHDLSNQQIKADAAEHAANGTRIVCFSFFPKQHIVTEMWPI
jgi:hypothetical protein